MNLRLQKITRFVSALSLVCFITLLAACESGRDSATSDSAQTGTNVTPSSNAPSANNSAANNSSAAATGNASSTTSTDTAEPGPEPAANVASFETITFPGEDELSVTADVYMQDDKHAPLIVLCHQAGWSRGEYREIAPKLNEMGFNCIAIDQRSGKSVNDVENQTVIAATEAGSGTEFADAEQDMLAAVSYARENYADGRILLWGSSYSSALALRIAGEHPDLVDGVLAFAPGEYFVRFDKPDDWIATSAAKISVPVFITSAKDEAPKWQAIFDAIPGETKTKYIPETAGNHGSRALWEQMDDHAGYWSALSDFLSEFQE